MSMKKIIGCFNRGFVLGFMAGLLIISLSISGLINVSEGMGLFWISIPFFIWSQLHRLVFLGGDFLSSILFGLITLVYFGVLGQLIFLLKLKPKVIAYWISLVLLAILNVAAYRYSINVFYSLEQAIKNLIH